MLATFDPTDQRYNLLVAEAFSDGPPHDIFDELREHDPVHLGYAPIDGRRVWSLTRYDDIRKVSGDAKIFSSTAGAAFTNHRPGKDITEGAIMSSDAPYHTRLRHFFNLGFAPRVTRHFEPWIRDIVRDIVKELRASTGEIDFLDVVAGKLPAMVIGVILGMPEEDRWHMLPWAQTILRASEGTPEGQEASLKAVDETIAYGMRLREHKIANPGDDMVSMLADAEYEGQRLSDQEYGHFVMTTVAAGFETTFTAIAQSCLLLMQNPDIYRNFKASADELMDTALIEMLRYITPAMQMVRIALQDAEIRGREIKAGDDVVMWYASANRDPAIFGPDRHSIDLRRKTAAYATFGAGGPHFCIGNQLARLEMRILFEELFKEGIWFETTEEPRRMKSLLINGLRKMPVKVIEG
jgi:cytochrome P450